MNFEFYIKNFFLSLKGIALPLTLILGPEKTWTLHPSGVKKDPEPSMRVKSGKYHLPRVHHCRAVTN